MGAARLKAETKWLRGFAQSYVAETGFSVQAEAYMRENGLTIGDVHYVMRHGVVTRSEKEDACGVYWEAIGETVEDARLRLSLEVHCDHYRMNVLRIEIVESDDD